MRGSLTYQVQTVWKRIDGIGTAKRERRRESSLVSLDGQRPVSDKVHSFQYKKEVLRTLTDIAAFARDSYGVKDLEDLSQPIVAAWLEEKLEAGLCQSTFKNYIAHLGKTLYAIKEMADEKNKPGKACTPEQLYTLRQAMLPLFQKTTRLNRAYENPMELIAYLPFDCHIIARLQLEYGLRITEASHIKAKQLEGSLLWFQGKGGYIQHKEIAPDLAEDIMRTMKNGLFEVCQNRYRKALQRAAAITGQEYHGSHGLRYSFAQHNYYEELTINLSRGKEIKSAERSAKLTTSKKLGHHREKITGHYLG